MGGGLTNAVLAGGEAATLVSAIRQREAEKLAAEHELSALERTTQAAAWDPATIERDLRARLTEWRELLRRQIPQARQVLKSRIK